MEIRRIPSSELYHHGIKGQEWGDRNGPPYPLDSNSSVQAKKKKKSLITKIKNKRKGKQLQKAKAAKKAEREEKEKIINSGDARQIKRISNKLTQEEMAIALNKIQFNNALDSYINGKNKTTANTGKSYLEKTESTIKTVASIAGSVGTIYGALQKTGVISEKKKDKTLNEIWKEKSELANNMKMYEENKYLTKRMQSGDYSHFKWYNKNNN